MGSPPPLQREAAASRTLVSGVWAEGTCVFRIRARSPHPLSLSGRAGSCLSPQLGSYQAREDSAIGDNRKATWTIWGPDIILKPLHLRRGALHQSSFTFSHNYSRTVDKTTSPFSILGPKLHLRNLTKKNNKTPYKRLAHPR